MLAGGTAQDPNISKAAESEPPRGRKRCGDAISPAKGMTRMGKLQGKVAVVTRRHHGNRFSPQQKRFVDEGAYVFITGRRQK